MTKREAAIISSFTGILVGSFAEVQKYGDEKFGRPTWTHEYGDRDFANKLKELSREDFLSIEII